MPYLHGPLPDDVHNQTLMANVHPVDWVNPTPEPIYTWWLSAQAPRA